LIVSQNARRALLVIDVQNEYVSGGLPIEYPDVHRSLANIANAIDAARDNFIPVVVVQNTAPPGAPIFGKGTPGWQLHESVTSRSHDHYVEKRLPSAFAGTDLGEWVAKNGIDTLVVVGYMTHNCDDSTIRHAVHAGIAVEFLEDAAGSVSYANRAGTVSAKDIHTAFAVVLQSRFAAVMSTAEWIKLIATAATPVRDSVFSSNQRARNLLPNNTSELGPGNATRRSR
jgi:nicotinamidase-related amidase